MEGDDEAENLRRDDEDHDAEMSRQEMAGNLGNVALVARTKAATTYPTVAGRYYACTPQVVSGPEIEGTEATFTPGTGTLLALNIGKQVPPVGTLIVVGFIGNRWVFSHG